VQYDFARKVHGTQRAEGMAVGAGTTLVAAAKRLRGYTVDRAVFPARPHLRQLSTLGRRPSCDADVLYAYRNGEYRPLIHPDESDPIRKARLPRIHVGRIGSGNLLLRDPEERERISKELRVLAIEREGAGIADATQLQTFPVPFLVVRGIADYGDDHKNDRWHLYASAVASALTLEILLQEPFPVRNQPVPSRLYSISRSRSATHHSLSRTCVNEKDGSTLVWMPAGRFQMGSHLADLLPHEYAPNESVPTECEPHTVELKGYWIGKYPITNRQYRKFMEETGHRPPNRWDDPNFNHPESPVIGVSWVDAGQYMTWAGLRLPTEAEWERAARGPGEHGRLFPWGDSEPDQLRLNWGRRQQGTTPVGHHAGGATPDHGLMDMAGNVMEWCRDSPRSYGSELAKNPHGGEGSLRVLRGGSFARNGNGCRAAYRDARDMNASWGSSGMRPAATTLRRTAQRPKQTRRSH